jgi:hypothetical protein
MAKSLELKSLPAARAKDVIFDTNINYALTTLLTTAAKRTNIALHAITIRSIL